MVDYVEFEDGIVGDDIDLDTGMEKIEEDARIVLNTVEKNKNTGNRTTCLMYKATMEVIRALKIVKKQSADDVIKELIKDYINPEDETVLLKSAGDENVKMAIQRMEETQKTKED